MNDATIARNLQALSHPRRVMIYRLLARRPELGASQEVLLDATGLAWASFHHHMTVLEASGLVRRRRKAGLVRYRLAPGELNAALAEAASLGSAAGDTRKAA